MQSIIGSVIEVENQAVDVPEIQGTVEEIAKEKCKRAAEVVSLLYSSLPAYVLPRLLIVGLNNSLD